MNILKAGFEILTPISEGGIDELKHIEKIGRVCYKSEGNITEDGESAKKFVKMLIERGHCFDEDTEILTLNGWKKYYELSDDDLYATLNENHIVEYLPKNKYMEYEYEGNMIQIDSPLVDLLVTDKHKMYACVTTTKEGRKKTKYELIEAKELVNKSHAYLKNSKGISFCGTDIPINIIKLIGFSIGDSNIDKNNLTFHLNKERKIQFLLNLLNSENIKYSIQNKNDGYKTFRIGLSTDNVLFNYIGIFKKIYNEEKEKVIPYELISSMNTNESISLLTGLLEADGSYSIIDNKYHSKYFCTTSKTLADQFQQLALHCGYSSNFGSEQKSGFGSAKTVYRLSLITRYNKPEINKSKHTKGKIKVLKNQKRKVWCINISPYHNVYVRRNGKAVWCGNCAMIEHSSLSIKFKVDRGVSHELVRHRIASFAQESTRYVNYSLDKFGNEINVIDIENSINLDNKMKNMDAEIIKEIIDEWLMAMIHAEKHYLRMIKLGATPQIARSVLPNSTKTEITITANYREWRNFFKLRVPETAHPSMREVTIPLLKELKTRLPIIFDDISEE